MPRARIVWITVALVAAGVALWWLARADDARLFALAADTGRVRWSAALPYGTRVVGNPVVAGARVVVSTAGPMPLVGGEDRWTLTAYDARSGRALWQYEPSPDRSRRLDAVTLGLTAPYLTADRVFVRDETNDGATLLVLDAATGRPTWTVDRHAYGRYSRHTDVTVSGDRILVPIWNGDDLEVHALRTDDGAALWRVNLGRNGFPESDLGPFLAASTDTFYIGLTDGIVALDAATGAERYRVSTPPATNGGQIVLANRLLYRRSGLQSVEAYDLTTGQEAWSYRPAFSEEWFGALRSFGVRDGLLAVYCACDPDGESRSGWLLGVDAATGQERWRVLIDAHLDLYQDMPVVGGGVAMSGAEDDDVVARAAMEGAERWRFPRERGQLISTDGRLVYVTDRAPYWRHWLALLGLSRQPSPD